MRTYVYIGTSLHDGVARKLVPSFDFFGPIKRGDIPMAVCENVERIVIIDGLFLQCLSVSIEEIRDALDIGVEVWGCSSMGALRAYEAAPIGMKGWGDVYALYKTGEIDCDDAVALIFDEQSRPITEPLVNILEALRFLENMRTLDSGQVRDLEEVARNLYFMSRTFQELFIQYGFSRSNVQKLLGILRYTRPYWDIKRRDAVTLLSHLSMFNL